MNLSPRAASLAVTVALHAAAFGALLQLDSVRKPLAEALPLMVHLVTPRKPEPPPPPKVEPPKPRPVAKQALPQVQAPEPPPILAAETTAPGPVLRAVPPPKAEPAPVVVAPAPAPRPAPVQPPSFDAAYLNNPSPVYPAMSKRRGEQGQVILRVYVTAEGLAERVEVRSSSGHARLDRAAHDAVHQWRFVPARQGDRPVPAWVLVPIDFKLEN